MFNSLERLGLLLAGFIRLQVLNIISFSLNQSADATRDDASFADVRRHGCVMEMLAVTRARLHKSRDANQDAPHSLPLRNIRRTCLEANP